MATQVEICNAALSYVGVPVNMILALGDTSREAQLCNLLYPLARDTVFEEGLWPFCKKRVELNSGAVASGLFWGAKQELPTDFLRGLYITEGGTDAGVMNRIESQIKFDIVSAVESGSDVSAKLCVFHNLGATATGYYLWYIAGGASEAQFFPAFDDAVALKLATMLSAPLGAPPELMERNFQLYLRQLQSARSAALNDRMVNDPPQAEWIDARNSGTEASR